MPGEEGDVVEVLDRSMSQSEIRDTVGEETKAMKLAPDTRYQYGRKMQNFKKWLMEHFPGALETVDEDEEDSENPEKYSVILPLDDVVLEAFMSHCLLKRNRHTGEYLDPPQFYALQHVNGYRCALKNLYTENRIRPSERAECIFKETLEGLKRRLAKLKEDGLMPQTEGKQPMSREGLKYLAEKSMTDDHDFKLYTFCHTFLLFCWNLIARAVTVSAIMYDHISWDSDAMTINISRMKNDQEGSKSYPRHIYANPTNPLICPILSFAILVFTKGFQRQGSERVIFGPPKTARDRFSKWLNTTCQTCASAIVSMGLIVSEIGSHSFRKGIATDLANCPGGPTAINIWLRAGWSLGPVQSRYIFQGPGGDQFVGRAATGLSLNDANFAVLPPHFDVSDGPPLTLEDWEDILPGYVSFYPQSFRVALGYLLASLVYHREWLRTNLPINHPLFLTRVMTSGILNRLASRVVTGVFMNKVTGMNASGVPEHVKLAHKLNEMELRLQNLKILLFPLLKSCRRRCVQNYSIILMSKGPFQ